MRYWFHKISLVSCAAIVFGAVSAFAFTVPPLNSPVTDEAQLLSPATKTRLEQSLDALHRGGGSQIAVLTVKSLDNLTIEQATIKVAEQWQLGTTKADNGVLLMIAPNDRGLRIEVGQGLEGDLPDAYAKRIVDDIIIPKFLQQEFDAGVIAGVAAIISKTDPNFAFNDYFAEQSPLTAPMTRRRGATPFSLFLLATIIIILLIISKLSAALPMAGMRGRHSRHGWGQNSNWGGERSSWGSGGFGGSGGGFSGGGASGRW